MTTTILHKITLQQYQKHTEVDGFFAFFVHFIFIDTNRLVAAASGIIYISSEILKGSEKMDV